MMTLTLDRTNTPSQSPEYPPQVVVIGAGFGGLAAAIRLGAKGYQVTIVDKLDGPGGRGYVFKQDGFTFDAGPTIITAPFVYEELWTICGKQMSHDVTLKSLDPFYKIRFDDGSEFHATADQDYMLEQIARFEPKDVEGYKRFMKASKDIFDVAYTQLVDVPFHEISLLVKSAPDLIRLGGYLSVYTKVAQFFSNENLRIAFSFHPLFIGGNPYSASAYYCLISYLEKTYGVHYAVGGTGALARGMVKLIEGHGNQVRYNCEGCDWQAGRN
jgi:phytoene desaturase